MNKENAAQRIERIKKEKCGLDVIKDIHVYASTDKEIDPEDIDRFKWYGLYTQNKSSQGDDESLYFMLRVKLEHGAATVEQIRTMAQISKEFARGTADFTTRQDLQFHFIRVKDLPEIFKRLQEVGLSTKFAAGDVPRNVTTCAVSGLDHDELCDTREIVDEINNFLRDNRDLANLPRKYKIAVSACAKHCINHEHQDLSFSAFVLNSEILFDVNVGGGLASGKRFADSIGYVKGEDILEVVKAVSYAFRDYGLRKSRRKARLSHLIEAWGVPKFKAHIEKELGFSLKTTPKLFYTAYKKREHFGVHLSKIKDTTYVGCAVNGGCMGADKLFALADIMEKNGASRIKTTITQNLVIEDVPKENTDVLVLELENIGINSYPNPFQATLLSCTGLNFCKFAISETKQTGIKLANYLYEKFPDFQEKVSIALSGCPNSCSHPNIVNIGLMGTKVQEENSEKSALGYTLLLGGNLQGKNSNFAVNTKFKVHANKLNKTIENILNQYLDSNEISINDFLAKKITEEKLPEFLQSLAVN